MSITRMAIGATGPIIDRAFAHSHPFQWARELVVNSIEAGAKNVVFTTEWQAAKQLGVHRRMVWDDGKGMTPEELPAFMNTFGGGGKVIGPALQNYGFGFKTSSLTWNRYGVVVISLSEEYESPAMIWLQYQPDPSGGENSDYGMKIFEVEGEKTNIITPGVLEDDPDELDWSSALPQEILDAGHGTAIILLGNTPTQDTVLGDPEKEDGMKYNLSEYLGYNRFWDFQGVEIKVREYINWTDRSKWPTSDAEAQTRTPKGISRQLKENADRIVAKGTVPVNTEDGKNPAKVHWILFNGWSNVRWQIPPGSFRVLFRHEFYNQEFVRIDDPGFDNSKTDRPVSRRARPGTTGGVWRFRQFGITSTRVRQYVMLVIEPAEYDEKAKTGVYPTQERTRLEIAGAGELPLDQWGEVFMDNMPKALRAALAEAEKRTDSGDDSAIDQKLWERFGRRWPTFRYIKDATGKVKTTLTFVGTKPTGTGSTDHSEGTGTTSAKHKAQKVTLNPKGSGTKPGGTDTARKTQIKVSLPAVEWFPASEFNEAYEAETERPRGEYIAGHFDEPGHNVTYPQGLLKLNAEHPVILEAIREWQSKRHPNVEEQVAEKVRQIYATAMKARMAHALQQAPALRPEERKRLFCDEAITLSVCGLYAEDMVIATHMATIGTKHNEKKKTA